MQKILRFDNTDQARDRIEFLYQGLCQSSKAQTPRDLKVLKHEGELRKKFEAVTVQKEKPASRFLWVPRTLPGTFEAPIDIVVDQEDLQMLRDYVPAAAWSAMVSDIVADAVEWAWGAPELLP